MTIKSKRDEINIIYDNFESCQATEPDSNGIFPPPKPSRMYVISAFKITKELIPEFFCVEAMVDGPITMGVNNIPEPLEYIISLKDIKIYFKSRTIAHLYFKILNSDFENVDLEKDYPELSL